MRTLLAVVLMLAGCAHLQAAGTAAKKCEIAQLPAESQALVTSVEAIALDPGSTVADLTALGVAVGKAQFTCIIQAAMALISNTPPVDSNTDIAHALVAANVDVRRDHALTVLSQYLTANQ